MPITKEEFDSWKSLLEDVTSRDRYRLRRQYLQLKEAYDDSGAESNTQDELTRFRADVDKSLSIVARRKQSVPNISFPEGLPISDKRDVIEQAIAKHQVVVIAGETGSGKTTQLPKICLALGRGVKGIIGHTQPRRLAARSVASRIAEEVNSPLGELVGYQVRFTDQVSSNTAVKLMTDGILLAEIQNDRFLSRYDTIIIDEAHERSLNIDFLLGYLKQLLPKRPDLKVIITSATIDVEKFSHHFNDAPVIEVSGRTYPVETLYRPLLETESDSLVQAIIHAVHEITSMDNQGDILVFLSGERDIRETALQLRREQIAHLNVVPLYARLSIAEQNKIFQSHRGRRIVLATNVAETSLTVPGIRYVIDPGYARISRYSFKTKVQRLPIEPVSQASANQRKGRCGRVSEGVCIRLYSEEDFLSRPEFTDPEILRTNLAAVILQMTQLRLGDIRHFPFVERPDHRLINDGYKLLQELQAINQQNKLTPLGRQLARLPVDPRFGRMLLAASQQGCLQEVSVIVSALSIQDPRERPAEKQQAADQKHREHWHEFSDFLAYWQLWQRYEEERQALSNNQLQRWCQKNFLAPNRMREWRDIHIQITLALKSVDVQWNQELADYSAVHQSLITGLLGNIAYFSKEKTRDYIGARNRRFHIFPGSSQFKKTPQWILAAELIETSRLYAHTIAKVEADWVLNAAKHLVKYQHVEPHYDARSGQVMAYEKISLYGLVLVEKKRVGYGKINTQESREIFIRSALVEGRYAEHQKIKRRLEKANTENHFFCWQQKLLSDLHKLEAKSRRQDIVVDDQVVFDFYDALLPGDIVNLEGFEHWREGIEKENPRLLFIDRSLLMQHSADNITEAQFPDSLNLDGIRAPLMYCFDPAHADDGVTVKVPVGVLHLLPQYQLEWLVPGLLREKIIAMIKSLPKQWRKQFVPVPAVADQLLLSLVPSDRPLGLCLGEKLYRQTGIQVPDQCWQDIELDDYYDMNIHVLDERGKLIDRGRDLARLRERYRDQVQDNLQSIGNEFEKTGLTQWDFGNLPSHCELSQNGLSIRAYPGLEDETESVSLKLYDNPQEALVASLKGMIRLSVLSQAHTVKYLRKQLLKNRDIGLSLVAMGSRDEVIDDIVCASVRQVCFPDSYGENTFEIVRTQADFDAAVEQGRSQLVSKAENIADQLVSSLELVAAIKKQSKQSKNALLFAYASADIQQQLSYLFYPGCLYDTPEQWLHEYPRYLKAIQMRLEKVPQQVQKDRAWIAELAPLWERYQQKIEKEGQVACALNGPLLHYRWMLEELRVSMFAQTLRTAIPVSIKRLNKQWELC